MPRVFWASLLGAGAIIGTVFAVGGVLIVVNTIRCRRIRRLLGTYPATTRTD